MEHVKITDVAEPVEQSAVGGLLVTLICSGKRATSRTPEAECDTVPLVSRQMYVPETEPKKKGSFKKKHKRYSDRKDRTTQQDLLN